MDTNNLAESGISAQRGQTTSEVEDVEGLDSSNSWGDYPIDDIFLRHEHRSVAEILRRIDEGTFVLNSDFPRGFVWPKNKQSKLIESAVLRIPMPVMYFAENDQGKKVVVDGLQRLTAFQEFIHGQLKLVLPDREELNGKVFSELEPRFMNRIEDCTFHIYIIDSKVPESARLDIFERVNSGEMLTRQQMRNCLFAGQATRFLRDESDTSDFLRATCGSLSASKMRDREFINRFCAFHVLGTDEYRGDMDEFLANCLRVINERDNKFVEGLRADLNRGLQNNIHLFGEHAFRRHESGQGRRSMINAALWDVMSTELSKHEENEIISKQEQLRSEIRTLLMNDDFNDAISRSTGATKQVRKRFDMVRDTVSKVLN